MRSEIPFIVTCHTPLPRPHVGNLGTRRANPQQKASGCSVCSLNFSLFMNLTQVAFTELEAMEQTIHSHS